MAFILVTKFEENQIIFLYVTAWELQKMICFINQGAITKKKMWLTSLKKMEKYLLKYCTETKRGRQTDKPKLISPVSVKAGDKKKMIKKILLVFSLMPLPSSEQFTNSQVSDYSILSLHSYILNNLQIAKCLTTLFSHATPKF